MTTTHDVVAVLAKSLCERIGESRYDLWFASKTRLAIKEGRLEVGVPNLFLQDWLKKTFGEDIQAAAADVLGANAAVRFVIDPSLFQAARAQQAAVSTSAVGTPAETPAPTPTRRVAPARRWKSLDDFVVGPGSRVAHAAALSLVETPEETPIPLVLHGSVGVGKSHLLEGIRSALGRRFPDWRILFLTAEEFTNRFVQAMHQHKLAAFRKQFRECDALLVEDVGFLAKKQATQEEFLHTLDALLTRHRPIVLTSDCHPRLADHFLSELTDRMVGGAVWSLAPPDRTTRLDLLRAKAARAGGLPDEVLDFLAEHLRGNVRELEGAIHSVVHLSRVADRPVDLDLAREAIGDLLRHSMRLLQIQDVEAACCEVLGVSRDLLFSKKRQWIYSYPRMLAMYLARKHTNATYSEVGSHFGGRNHSTVVAGEKRVRQWLKENITLQLGKRIMPARDLVDEIERKLER